MPAYSGYLVIKSLLVGLVGQTHCLATLPHGNIICVSDESGANIEGTSYLTTKEVKAQVTKTYSESDVKPVLEKIPELYKYKWTVFTNLDQKNAMKDDYIFMKNQLQSIKDEVESTPPELRSSPDFIKASKTIEQLEDFQELILKGIQDRIFMEGQRSHIQKIEIHGLGENGPLKKKAKIASSSSGTAVSKDLGIDLVEEISDRVWDGQVDRLSGILHGIPLLRDDDQKIKTEGNELYLGLQNLLFQQIGYMYKQKMISGEAFKKFFQSKITLVMAVLNMIHTIPSPMPLMNLSPVTILNDWTSENYRKMYEVLDDKYKRYFSYILLKVFDGLFYWEKTVYIKALFEEDKLFKILENSVSSISRKSNSWMYSQELRNVDPDYVKIQASVKELIPIFEDDEEHSYQTINRKRAFFIFDFIKTHYGLEFFELEKHDKLEERMSVMESSFQISGELCNIISYVKEEELPGEKVSANKNIDGEEILKIYQLSQHLISKHQGFFVYSEMSKYCRTNILNFLSQEIDDFITKIIDKNKYYLK